MPPSAAWCFWKTCIVTCACLPSASSSSLAKLKYASLYQPLRIFSTGSRKTSGPSRRRRAEPSFIERSLPGGHVGYPPMGEMRRNPIRSEGDAFRLTIALAALVAVAGFIGSLTGPGEGIATFAVLALAGLAAYLSVPESGRPRPLRMAAQEPHPHAPAPGTRRVLVLANAPPEGEALRERP